MIDFTPFKVNTEGHSHIAMKVPCDSNGNPKVIIIAGVTPDFKTVKMEGVGPIMTGTLDGKSILLYIKVYYVYTMETYLQVQLIFLWQSKEESPI